METKTTRITSKIAVNERETHIYRCDDGWMMDSTVPKDYNAAMRKGWVPVAQTVYEDGTVCGMVLKAIPSAVTIRNNTKRRVSDEQKAAAAEALRKYREG
jgi:hypothetical protein